MPKLLPILFCALALASIGLSPLPIRAQDAPQEVRITPQNPASVLVGIQAAIKAGKRQVVIPPGVYKIPGSSTPRGKDGAHWRLENIKDFTIVADGVTLIFTDKYQHSIVFLNCENVTLKGAKLERETIPFSQGRIEAVSVKDNTIDIRMDKGYPQDLMDRSMFSVIWLNVIDPESKLWLTHLRAGSPPVMEQLEPGFFRVKTEPIRNVGIPIVPGQQFVLRGNVYNDLVVSRCKDMKILDITVERGAGFAFAERGGEGNNLFQNCKVIPGDTPSGATEAPLFSCNADGFHSGDVRKGPTLINCHFERTDDDAIAIHGTYSLVLESQGNTLTIQRNASSGTPLFARPGDTLRLYDKRMVLAGTATITETKKLTDYQPTFMPDNSLGVFRNRSSAAYIQLTLDKPLTAEAGCLVTNQNELGSGYVIRDCTFKNTYARGIIAKASDGLIEGCTFENTTRAAVEFNTETGIWSESDFVQNVIVRNNLIKSVSRNVKTGLLRHPGAISMFAYKDKGYVVSPGGHRNITIENNTFIDNDGVNIFVCSASGVVIRNNKFIRPMINAKSLGKERSVDPTTLIWVDQSTKVQASGNTLESPGKFFGQAATATPATADINLKNAIK